MNNTVKIKTYAKLNLSLEITGVKDGYHMLDSLVTSIDLCDAITLRRRKDKLVNVTMHGQGSESIPPEKNVAVKAAEKFVETYDTCGADITIYKDIPMGGGIGGSSADASGVLNGMARLYEIADDAGIKALADSLGSDTGYMLRGGFARMTGRGEQVWKLPKSPKLWFVLVCPSAPVSTPACYKKYDEMGGVSVHRGGTEKCIQALLNDQISDMGASFGNDLYLPACELEPKVKDALEKLKALSPLGYGMSGSGSTVFAMFETRELCEWARSRYKGWERVEIARSIDPEELSKPSGIFKWRSPYYLSSEEIAAAQTPSSSSRGNNKEKEE